MCLRLNLVFAVLAACSLTANPGDPEKFSTRDIDVVLRDENGLNHFLVFHKVKRRGTTPLYSMTLRVNDAADVRGNSVWSFLLRTDSENYANRLTDWDASEGGPQATRLHFDIAEEDLIALSKANSIRPRLVFEGSQIAAFPFSDYFLVSDRAFQQAVTRILQSGK